MTELHASLEAARLPILTAYYAVLAVLAVYGLHRFALLVILARRHRRAEMPRLAEGEWPRVTVQLPIYNELHVAPRLVEAVCGLDYPRDRLEIQVLDDSDDETAELLAASVDLFRSRGFDIRHLRRHDRSGFKAGALEAGLRSARGELIAIFDADFVPPSDFLRRTVPWFEDVDTGMVQACWGHRNREASWLTRAQAILLDGHFLVEHAARAASGRFFNFNGTAGVWRRQAIEEAGGWQHDTLTEDLDLSYRAQLRGWRFRFLPDLVVPAELPADVSAFKSQQRRWARGAAQTARKLLLRVLRSPLPWRVKAEAALHLTGNFSYVLLPVLALLMFPAMVLRHEAQRWQVWAIDAPLFAGATLAVLLFYLVGERLAGRRLRAEWVRVPAAMALGVGISLNNAGAVLGGLARMGGVFVRTPKNADGSAGGDTDSRSPVRYRSSRGRSAPFELLFAVYLGVCLAAAVALGMWWSLPFLWLFFQGYAAIATAGLIELRHEAQLRTGRLSLSRPAA